MTENSENERLPYPKMDIDFLRREIRGKGVVQYTCKILTTIHYRVRYTCCFCGAENRDDEQAFELKNSVFAYDPTTRVEKEEQVIRNIKRQAGRQAAALREQDIAARKYELLGLKCRCARCGKKQPWSDFRPVSGVFARIRMPDPSLAVIASLLLLFAFVWLFSALPWAGAAIPVLLSVPSLAALVHNSRMRKKNLRLEEAFRPEIRIVYQSEDAAREER